MPPASLSELLQQYSTAVTIPKLTLIQQNSSEQADLFLFFSGLTVLINLLLTNPKKAYVSVYRSLIQTSSRLDSVVKTLLTINENHFSQAEKFIQVSLKKKNSILLSRRHLAVALLFWLHNDCISSQRLLHITTKSLTSV